MFQLLFLTSDVVQSSKMQTCHFLLSSRSQTYVGNLLITNHFDIVLQSQYNRFTKLIFIAKIIMHRSATSHSCRRLINTPTPIQEIQNRKQALLSRNNSRGHKSQLAFKEVSTPFRETAVTFNRLNQGQRIRSSSEAQRTNGFLSQNFNLTEERKWNSRNSIPLRLLRMTKLAQEQNQDKFPIYSDRFTSRKQFLRKGTAINRAIMFNVLKSKCNKNIVDSASSYVNYPGNQPLAAAIYDQVPKGLRDVIGGEQMLRMSNIFTGGTINAINIHRKVSEVINKYHEKKEPPAQQDEGMTLKSIKRW